MPSQLQINQGPQDALLYDNSRSYFTNQGYSRTSNFQVELKDLNSTSQAGWGQSIRFPVSKSGDLLGPCDLLMNFTTLNWTLQWGVLATTARLRG